MTDNNRRFAKFIVLPIVAIAAISVLSSGKSTVPAPVANATASTTVTETRTRAKLDYAIKAKAIANGFGMTVQQYYASLSAADKAGISETEWHYAMTLFIQRISDLRSRGYLFNQLYSKGAGQYAIAASDSGTTAFEALELSLNMIAALNSEKPGAARSFSDEIGLGGAGVVVKFEDIKAELPHLSHLTDDYFAQAKKARDAMIDAERR
jgi:hypothetical protein